MNQKKNYKFTNDVKRIGPKLKWFLFTEMQDLKLTSDYINFICPGNDKTEYEKSNPIESLRTLIEHALVREFSPKIKKTKSFNLLVDSIMYKFQKEALAEDGDLKSILED